MCQAAEGPERTADPIARPSLSLQLSCRLDEQFDEVVEVLAGHADRGIAILDEDVLALLIVPDIDQRLARRQPFSQVLDRAPPLISSNPIMTCISAPCNPFVRGYLIPLKIMFTAE